MTDKKATQRPGAKPVDSKSRANGKRNQVNMEAVAVSQRRARVAQFITAGLTYRQIADQEQVSIGTVAADRAAILAEWQESYIEVLHENMLVDLKRSEELITDCTMKIRQYPDDPRWHAVYIKTLNFRKETLGYAARDRREQPIRFPSIEPAIETRGDVVDADGDLVTDKSPVAAVFALLGGKRQSGGAGRPVTPTDDLPAGQ